MGSIKFKDVGYLQGGYAFKSADFIKNATPIIRIGNISDNSVSIDNEVTVDNEKLKKDHPEFVVTKNDILVAMSGATVGKIGIYNEDVDSLLNQRVGKFVVKNNLRNKYLYYVLQSELFKKYILNNAFGCAQPNISGKQIEEFEFKIYSLEEQDKIIEKLDILSELMELRKKQLLDLDNLIKSQFVEMFSNTFERRRLEEFSTLITKGASPRWQGVEYQDNGVLFVTSENVREGYIDISKPKYLDEKINEILPRSILKKGDILINIVGASIGRAAQYNYDYLANINQAVALVRTKNINNTFLLTFLNTDEAISLYDSMKKDGARANLSLKNIADIQIPNAPIELQKQFADIVEQIDKQKFEIQKSLEEMQKLQESLMNKYFG